MHDDNPRGFASSPCSAHEFALAERLNELLESERAGARGLIQMKSECEDAELADVLERVSHDEARFCAMLGRHVARLGGTPSRETGAFYDKLLARETRIDQLRLLDRGQSAVVRTLDAMLAEPLDPALRRDLEDMRATHVQNIALCARYLP